MNTEEKESRQLLRLNKEASRKKPLHYIGVAMILLTIIYIVDEITSNMNAAMQPYVLFDLFNISSRNVNTPEYTKAFNVVAPIQVFSNLLLIITKNSAKVFALAEFFIILSIVFGGFWAHIPFLCIMFLPFCGHNIL